MSLCNQPAEELAVELGGALKDLRTALNVVLRLVQQLEQHATFVAVIAQGRAVQIKRKSPPPTDGQPRGRGRPKGAPNNITLFASDVEIARLRAELAPVP
jgi:hypothetical protein